MLDDRKMADVFARHDRHAFLDRAIGVDDPTTAVQALHRITDLLARVADRLYAIENGPSGLSSSVWNDQLIV